ncbi:MAG: flagellar hook capping FlgD N-terminal domain-containing protein [Bacillota bacterium]
MSISITSTQKTIEQIIAEGESKVSSRNTGELGKDDFLNLLVMQLRYQDPLNPTDDKEFIGQMAQFSALEQMQNLNVSFAATKAYSLIGKRVIANITDPTTKRITEIDGDVSSVMYSSGKYYAIVRGVEVPIDDIVHVTEGTYSSQSSLSAFTGLIGCQVNGIVYNPLDGDMIKVSGIVRALQKGIYEDYAVMDGVSVEIAGLDNSVKTTDANYVRDTLTAAYESGELIDIIIKDSSTGKRVPVTAKIVALDFAENGKITAVLDGVHVPLESITNISKPSENKPEDGTSATGEDTENGIQDGTAETDGDSGESTGTEVDGSGN